MKKRPSDTNTIYGITWLDRDEWQKMRAVATDSTALMITYEEWVMMTTRAIKDLEKTGRRVKKVAITAEDFAAWCAANSKEPNSAARSEYVSFVLATQRALRQSNRQISVDSDE
jgi:hypothetical protein